MSVLLLLLLIFEKRRKVASAESSRLSRNFVNHFSVKKIDLPNFELLTVVFVVVQYITEFGTDHIYNTDTFNENQPKSRYY